MFERSELQLFTTSCMALRMMKLTLKTIYLCNHSNMYLTLFNILLLNFGNFLAPIFPYIEYCDNYPFLFLF
jgi:hypothetical protein